MFLVGFDKFFTRTVALASAVESTDTTSIPGQQYKMFGQLINAGTGNIELREILVNASTLTSQIPANSVYIAAGVGYDLTTEILESFGPLQGIIKKIYVLNMAPKATYTNVRVYPYSATGRFRVEISTDGSVWTDQSLTVPVWQPREIKEFYLRVRLVNSSKPADAIGVAFGYDSVTGITSFAEAGTHATTVSYSSYSQYTGYILPGPWRLLVSTNSNSNNFQVLRLNVSTRAVTTLVSGTSPLGQGHIAVSQNGLYVFAYNRLYRTDTWATVFTVSDVDSSIYNCAAITPDNQFLVYMSTTGLKVVSIPSGELVRSYPAMINSTLNRAVGLWAKSPTDIWFFAGRNVVRFDTQTQSVTNLVANASTNIYVQALDERYVLFSAFRPFVNMVIFDTYTESYKEHILPISCQSFLPYVSGTCIFSCDGPIFSPSGMLVPALVSTLRFYSDSFLYQSDSLRCY